MSQQTATASARIATPTRSFTINLARITNFTQLLQEHKLEDFELEGGYRYIFRFPPTNPTTLTLYDPFEKGEIIDGKTLLERGHEVENGRFDLPSFLAVLNAQKQIPKECRGEVIICEDVLVDGDHGRNLACARYDDEEKKRWITHLFRVNGGWGGGIRLARLG